MKIEEDLANKNLIIRPSVEVRMRIYIDLSSQQSTSANEDRDAAIGNIFIRAGLFFRDNE